MIKTSISQVALCTVNTTYNWITQESFQEYNIIKELNGIFFVENIRKYLYKGYCLKGSTIKSLWYVNSDQNLIDSERIEYLPSKIRWEIRKLMALSDLQIVSKVYSLKNNYTWTNNMIQIDTLIGFPQFGNKCMKIQFWHFYLSSMDSFSVLHTNR